MPLTFEDLVARKKPARKTVWIAVDPNLAGELEEARRARDVAANKANVRPKDNDAQARLWEADERLTEITARMEAENAVVPFVFQAIGRATYEALVDSHPPNRTHREKAKALGFGDTVLWNPETFPAALVAACLVDPKMTEEEAQLLWKDDNWSQAELDWLFKEAVEINGTRRSADLGKDWPTTLSSGPS